MIDVNKEFVRKRKIGRSFEFPSANTLHFRHSRCRSANWT